MTEANAGFKKKIAIAATAGTLSHALILCGAGDKESLAEYVAAAYECTSQQKPCFTCHQCRKVKERIHPDVIWLEDDKRKQFQADYVREFRKDVFIRPNEGERKVYIVKDSNQLNPTGQNFLLKTIEEGPPYAAFVFCTENSANLLETIRSRCVEYQLEPPAENEETAVENAMAIQLLESLKEGKKLTAIAFLLGQEKNKLSRDDLAVFLDAFRELLTKYMTGPEKGSLTDAAAMRLADKCKELRYLCDRNIGAGHLLGELAITIDLEVENEKRGRNTL